MGKRITQALIRKTNDADGLLQIYYNINGMMLDIYESCEDYKLNEKWISLDDRFDLIVKRLGEIDAPKLSEQKKEWKDMSSDDVFNFQFSLSSNEIIIE